MNKVQAQVSMRNLYGEIMSLAPSALVTMFEIDLTDILINNGIITSATIGNESQRIFRFHNNISMVNKDVTWQSNLYIALPIRAEDFEYNGKGALPTPKLTLAVNSEGIPALAALKDGLARFSDLVGCKVTRIRTLVKFLDAINFEGNTNPTADPNAEFPRDVYYIDRKSQESKDSFQFELASLIDVEGVKLPFRRVIASRCAHTYRGEGCLYELEPNPLVPSTSRRVTLVHGEYPFSRLPTAAPPIANEKDELISDLIGTTSFNDRGKYNLSSSYARGDYVYIERDGIKYYFVAKTSVTNNLPPPDEDFWVNDLCSKLIKGCRYRWGDSGPGRLNGNPFNGALPYGGFIASNRFGNVGA